MCEEEIIDLEHLDILVERCKPYIIRVVSNVTGRYVSVESDDAFSVALNAFAEAVERFDPQRGSFLNYAGLVIRSRLTTWLEQENRRRSELSLDALCSVGREPEALTEEQRELQEEILLYQMELGKFGLTLDSMADHSPKHRDTRDRAERVAEQASRDEAIVQDTYRKKKLPIRQVARLCLVSEKIVKTSRVFILGTMLVFVQKLTSLMGWIREVGCDHA